jgi:hypothetical protein
VKRLTEWLPSLRPGAQPSPTGRRSNPRPPRSSRQGDRRLWELTRWFRRCKRRGASILAVARMLGHSDPSVTLKVYAGFYTDDLQALADGRGRRLVHQGRKGETRVRQPVHTRRRWQSAASRRLRVRGCSLLPLQADPHAGVSSLPQGRRDSQFAETPDPHMAAFPVRGAHSRRGARRTVVQWSRRRAA